MYLVINIALMMFVLLTDLPIKLDMILIGIQLLSVIGSLSE